MSEKEKTSAGKNDVSKEIDPKAEQSKQKSSDENSVNTQAKVENENGGLKPDEVLTSTMTGQVVAKKSDEKQIEAAEETKIGYDDWLAERNQNREIQGGEQVVTSGLDKGRPINGDGLVDTTVPSNHEARFNETSESK